MVAKNPAETDEQIIDLTELIEKGEVPANDSSAQAQHVETEQETLQKHLNSLNDGAAPADPAIDDLLAQMDQKEDAAQQADVALDFSAPSTQTDHPIDPNEELHMPGMGDVDNLLNSLDIPPQPGEREAAPAPEGADQAVDSLLNDFAAPAAPSAPASAAAPQADAPQGGVLDLDALLAAAEQPQQPTPTPSIDDLLREGQAATVAPAQPAADATARPQTPPAAKGAATFSSDELDSLLAAANVEPARPAPQAAAQKPAAVVAEAVADAAPQQNLQPEQTAQPTTATPAAASLPDGPDAGMEMDIDSLLAAAANDLETNLSAPQAAAQEPAAPAPAPEAPQPAMPVDIDSLLAAAKEAPEAAPDAAAQNDMPNGAHTVSPAEPEPAAAPDVAPDAALQPELQPEPLAPPVAEPEPMAAPTPEAPQPAMPVDIDSLLAAASETPEAAPEAAAQNDMPNDTHAVFPTEPEPAAAPDVAPDAALQPELQPEPLAPPVAAPEPTAAPAPEAPQPAVPVDIDSLLAAANEAPDAAPDAMPEAAPEAPQDPTSAAAALVPEAAAEEDMGPDFDALLAAAAAELTTMAPADAAAETPAAQPQADGLPLLEPDEILPPDAAMPADMQPDAALLTEERMPAEESGPQTAAMSAASVATLEAVMAQASAASSHAVDAFEQAFEASTRAADAAEAVAGLSARVAQCEQALQEAGERIIALETALEAQIAAVQELTASALPRQELEALFTEEHPLHHKLVALVADAVAQVQAPAPQADPETAQAAMDERLQPVVTATRSITARMDALETRLDELEPRFNDRVEKAAAGAAARILREEISRLLDEQ